MNPRETRPEAERGDRSQHGSALVLAIFVLLLLAGMGTALMFLSETEQKMSQANLRTKKAFYFAEAGLEAARETLYAVNRNEDFDDDLSDGAGGGAGGLDNELDFDADALVPSWNSDGSFSGFSGFDDDVPITGPTTVAGGTYAAWIVNDPLDGELVEADSNSRLLVTSAGAGDDRSFEIVQAVIEKIDVFPTVAPATITLLGPTPVFDGGKSAVKRYVGDDCDGSGEPGLYVPILGAVGSDAEASAESGIFSNPNFESGGLSPDDTFADLTDPSEPALGPSGYTHNTDWDDCQAIVDMIESLRLVADSTCCTQAAVCPVVSACSYPSMFPGHIWFIDGDYTVPVSAPAGQGVMVVTGTLNFHGNANWSGLVLALGRGNFVKYGGGNGVISGGTVAANIAGSDGIYGTSDDCTGADNGFDIVNYDESGGGNSATIYCTADLAMHNPVRPYEIVEFLQW